MIDTDDTPSEITLRVMRDRDTHDGSIYDEARETMSEVQAHFVTFYSPGTFVAETTEKPIHSWDTDTAMKMAHGIEERYGATPYAFRFTTRGRGPKDLDSREVERSCLYHLGGKIETFAEVEARNDPKEDILRSNMRGNGYDRIVVNDNSWRSVHPFGKDDVMLDWKPKKKHKAA